MQCPVCQKSMVEEDFGNVNVDVCEAGCKSMWFDWLELGKLDEKNEGFGAALQTALQYPRANDSNRPALNCPRCHVPLHAHKYKSDKEVNVDECYKCGGFFLDSGELKEIRDHFMTESEELAYRNKILSQMPIAQEARADLEKEKVRTEAAENLTRFFRLSYYVGRK